MQTTDDQLGHLIQKIENCRTDIVQKLRLDALKNIVADHLALTDGQDHTPPWQMRRYRNLRRMTI